LYSVIRGLTTALLAYFVGCLIFQVNPFQGDVLLALPQDRFALGLASFLVAHLCYIAAFVGRSGFHMTPWLLAAFLLFGGLMLVFLWPSVPKQLRLPVGVYVAVILVMGWQATEQWMAVPSQSALLAMLGAFLFVTSDSALAINRFGHPFRAEFVVVMSTYYLAQWLLALSVVQV